MHKISVYGVNRLEGHIKVQGSKNAVLPILAATLVNGGECIIHKCPCLSDVMAAIEILKCLGCDVKTECDTVWVNSRNANSHSIPCELMQKIRSSFVFMGAMLARFNEADLCMPGGCNIGSRPVNLHLNAFNILGCETLCEDDSVFARCTTRHGGVVKLNFPSVGATENIMLFACKGRGTTQILNAACEPEIYDLANFLNCMGADIKGAGTPTVTIYAVEKLNNAEYTVMADRIEQATLMAAAAVTGGYVEISDCCNNSLNSFFTLLETLGVDAYAIGNTRCTVNGSGKMLEDGGYVNVLTMPYPGFPTDCQSLAMTLLAISCGNGMIAENIFENRMKHADELAKMGANIKVSGKYAYIHGVGELNGANVNAYDLRSGAALVLAGLGAKGRTIVNNAEYIYRGYEALEQKLNSLGANVERIE